MGFSAIYMVMSGLFGLLLIAGIWVGVIVLAKTGRTLSWWAMLIGLILSTLGGVLYVVFIGVVVSSAMGGMHAGGAAGTASSPPPSTNMAAAIGSGLCMIGALLGVVMFGVGFAMHAFQMARLARRAAELETLCASMVAHGGGMPVGSNLEGRGF
jgi:LPXTG-motif cell wall-anchored protein